MTTQNISTQFSASIKSQNIKSQSAAALTIDALGVVYGDIGTSPLYTFQEIFRSATGVALDALHITGAVPTIFLGVDVGGYAEICVANFADVSLLTNLSE